MHFNRKNVRHSGAARISVLYFAFAVAASAQAQSTLHGRVLDPLGAPVPNAKVEILNTPAETTSASDGSYTLAAACPCTTCA